MTQTRIPSASAELQKEIERHFAAGMAAKSDADAIRCFKQFREALERGDIRAAEPDGQDGWKTNEWVKRGILLGFRLGELTDFSGASLSFIDKDTFPARKLGTADRIRIVPGGSSIRRGAFVAPGVICMPPMYINVGAHVEEGTLVDSHALVGSCAQIGKRVHISAAAQIGGVLEPVNASPVIIEDDVLVGGNCGVYEGTLVRSRAVLAAGVILTRGTPVYDVVTGEVLRGTPDEPLTIPPNAVVVPGSREMTRGLGANWGLSVYTPIIIKYRDEKTDTAVSLEDVLR